MKFLLLVVAVLVVGSVSARPGVSDSIPKLTDNNVNTVADSVDRLISEVKKLLANILSTIALETANTFRQQLLDIELGTKTLSDKLVISARTGRLSINDSELLKIVRNLLELVGAAVLEKRLSGVIPEVGDVLSKLTGDVNAIPGGVNQLVGTLGYIVDRVFSEVKKLFGDIGSASEVANTFGQQLSGIEYGIKALLNNFVISARTGRLCSNDISELLKKVQNLLKIVGAAVVEKHFSSVTSDVYQLMRTVLGSVKF